MKKIIIAILSLVPFLVKSQVLVERSPKTVIPEDRNLYTTFNFKLPVYSDTTHANALMFKDSLGLQFYNLFDSAVYTRSYGLGPAHRWLKGTGGGGGGAVSSVFTRAGNVVAVAGDYSAFYPLLTGSYSDPSWITSLNAAKISGASTVTPGSTKISLGGSPGGASLQPFSIDVVPGNILIPTLGGLLGVGQINATGSASSSTFLRGDGTWSSPGSTVTGLPNSWIGAGFRWTVNFTNNVKTLFVNSYIIADSTSNTNGITIRNDTSQVATKTDLLKYSVLNLDTVLSRGGRFSANRTSDLSGHSWTLDSALKITVGYNNNNLGLSGTNMFGANHYASGTVSYSLISGFNDSVYDGSDLLVVGQQNIIGFAGGGGGSNSAIIGYNNKSQGGYGLTVGYQNVNYSDNSTVFGGSDTSDVSMSGNLVAGGQSRAQSSNDFISGFNLKLDRQAQAAFGIYNDTANANYYRFMIGNGTADNARHNAFAIDNLGYIYATGVVNQAGFKFIMPTDGVSDTLATRAFVRGLGGGGGGGLTPPLADNTALIKNNTDNSKLARFDASGITTATTRVYTFPDATGTLVLATNTQTLTGKTIASGSNTITGLTNTNLNGAAAITNANLNVMAGHTYKGNNTGSSVVPIDVTNTQLTADLLTFTASNQGVVPASGGGTVNYLRADGVWVSLGDTLTLRTPGTGTGAIPLAFVNGGNLVIPKIAPGTNVTFSVASDSLITINASGGGSTLATASGDATGTVSGTNLPLTLATVNSNVGSFGDATHVPAITVNAKGLVTAVTSTAIAAVGYATSTAVNTANYTVPAGRRIFILLNDLTGQANRNVILQATPTAGDEVVLKNNNPASSGFTWIFTNATVKDNSNTGVTTLVNNTVYHLVYNGTNYDIIN